MGLIHDDPDLAAQRDIAVGDDNPISAFTDEPGSGCFRPDE